jgi:hypothetical protein
LELNSITKFADSKLLGGGLAVTVTVCVSVADWSAVDVAVIVTVPPVGIAGGAVYDVAAPLAVCAGEKLPQLPGLEHVTDQSTPALLESLVTAAISWALRPCTIVPFGTVWLIFKETGATIVTFTCSLANCALLPAVACATICTTGLGLGTLAGAVKNA